MSDAVRYLILPRMVVNDFNAESNQYVAGIPAMTAFTGYGHVLERKMQAAGWHFQVEGVAVMMHELSLQPGHPKCPDALPGTKEKDVLAPRIIEEMKGDMRVTLVLRLVWNQRDRTAQAWVRGEFDAFGQDDLACVYDWVMATPCCGGSCHSISSIKVTDGEDDSEFATKHLRRIHQRDNGYFLIPREDLITKAQADGQDALDALLDTQRRTLQEEGQWRRDAWIREQKLWLVPLAVGYQAIELPQSHRAGSRKSAPHVYAEPLTGLGELSYAGRLLWAADFELEPLSWVHRHDPEQHIYYVTTLNGDE